MHEETFEMKEIRTCLLFLLQGFQGYPTALPGCGPKNDARMLWMVEDIRVFFLLRPFPALPLGSETV